MDRAADIRKQIAAAAKSGDSRRAGALRMLLAEIQKTAPNPRADLSDGDFFALVARMQKQRRESIAQFAAAGRDDLAAAEQFEIDVLRDFAPPPLAPAEVDSEIEKAIAATDAQSPRDMGKVMAALKPRLVGRADFAAASAKVKAILSS